MFAVLIKYLTVFLFKINEIITKYKDLPEMDSVSKTVFKLAASYQQYYMENKDDIADALKALTGGASLIIPGAIIMIVSFLFVFNLN